MYFGQPMRPFNRPMYAPVARGVAARPFSPVSRGVPAPQRFAPPPTAPSVQRVLPRIAPNAWAARVQRIQARQAANQRREGLQALPADARRDALAAEIRRIAAARGGMTEAQARALFQQMLAAQAAQATAVAVQTPAPTAMPQISPGSPEADLRPTQDAADGGEQPESAPPSSKNKFLLIGLALVAVGGVGYVVMTHKKKPKVA